MKISVCFPCVNEQQQAVETARSIRETAGDAVQIVCCDDASAEIISFPPELGVVVHRNHYRIGSGASRHVLGYVAKGDYLFITDSHVRFQKGWLEAALEGIEKYPMDSFCGICKGFTPVVPAFSPKPSGIYYGGDLQFIGHDPNQANRIQVLESIWAKECDDFSYRSSLLGANYLVPRKRFIQLGGMNHLRSWGVEEQMLSLKLLLSGDDIRILTKMVTWHRFRDGEKMPFRLESWNILWNKIFTIRTIFPDDMADRMISRLGNGFDFNKAQEMIKSDWRLVEAERQHNKSLFVHDVEWLLNKFQIPLL